MKSALFVIFCSALMLAGCGDKDDAAQTGSGDSAVVDKAAQMTGDSADQVKQAASDTIAALGDAAQANATQLAEQAGDAAPGAAQAVDEGAAELADQVAGAVESAAAEAGAADEMAGKAAGATEDAVTAAAETAETVVADAGQVGAGAVVAATGAADAQLAAGQEVYEGKCKACHATGAAGSPKLGDATNWGPRIEQGMDTLVKHALEGYKGSAGYMPPKGGFVNLSDEEVAAAVAYMVSESQ